MRKYRENTSDGPLIHVNCANGDDRTLCGAALEGLNGETPMQLVKTGKINCADCGRIINHCQLITHHHLAHRGARRTTLDRMLARQEGETLTAEGRS
jgi:hypothetical protein